MVGTVTRRKIEILVDAPLLRRVTTAAEAAGVIAYTLLPALGGAGHRGGWSDDQVTGAQAKMLFWTIVDDARAAALLDAIAPLLDSHGMILTSTMVEVIRGDSF